MKAQVTSKGQVTIPKELRERFGIEPGAQIDFAAREDGIMLRKVVDRRKQRRVLGCLKTELAGRSVLIFWRNCAGRSTCPKVGGKETAGERHCA